MPSLKPPTTTPATIETAIEPRNALVMIPDPAPAVPPAIETQPAKPETTEPEAVAPVVRAVDYTEPGSVFVRTCCECGSTHQTYDGSGKLPCRACAEKKPGVFKTVNVARVDIDATEPSGQVLGRPSTASSAPEPLPPVLEAPPPAGRTK